MRSAHPSSLRRFALAALSITFVGALGACDGTTTPDDDLTPITRLPRDLTSAETEVIARSTDFGLELMARTVARDARPNIVLSPLSASMALGMTLNGAAAGTFDDMRATLGFEGLPQSEINAGYASLIDLLSDLDPAVDFAIGNAVFANEGFPFHTSFFDAVSGAFDATVQTRDFAQASTLDAINGWADTATNGMIPRVLDELDANLVMLLMNAISFDGAWTEAFDPGDTRPAAFQRAQGGPVDVPMMQASQVELALGYGSGWSAVELPYGGGAYGMVIVVPAGDVRSLVAGWDSADWSAVLASLSPQTVDLVSIPRFRLAYDAFLNPVLTDMGMGVAFRRGADFSNLSPRGDELCIDFVRQKTFIEVDEVGTRAAAVTTVGIGPTSFTGVVADRPFFFALRERLSGTLLFTGIIGDPTIDDSGLDAGEGTCS
jgi:serpin B